MELGQAGAIQTDSQWELSKVFAGLHPEVEAQSPLGVPRYSGRRVLGSVTVYDK